MQREFCFLWRAEHSNFLKKKNKTKQHQQQHQEQFFGNQKLMFRIITKRNEWFRMITYKFAEQLFLVTQTFITPLYNTVKDCVPDWFVTHFTLSNVHLVINLWSWRCYAAFTQHLALWRVSRGKKAQVNCHSGKNKNVRCEEVVVVEGWPSALVWP